MEAPCTLEEDMKSLDERLWSDVSPTGNLPGIASLSGKWK
jgi:hypothetical protein